MIILSSVLNIYLDESLAHHGAFADVADEALVVPRQALKRNKLGAAQSALA